MINIIFAQADGGWFTSKHGTWQETERVKMRPVLLLLLAFLSLLVNADIFEIKLDKVVFGISFM